MKNFYYSILILFLITQTISIAAPVNIEDAIADKPVNSPTLDYLTTYTSGVVMSDGSTVVITSDSAYNLTETELTGQNIITKYIYDEAAQTTAGMNYEVTLKDDGIYGEGDNSKTYTVNGINGGSYTVTVQYDSITYSSLHKNNKSVTNGSVISGAGGGAVRNTSGGKPYSGGYGSNYTTISASSTNSSKTAQVKSSGGGAIYNSSGTIKEIDDIFINNYSKISSQSTKTGSSTYSASTVSGGGAVYNNSTITEINACFANNYSKITSTSKTDAKSTESGGGAIYNNGTINNLNGDFVANYATITSSAPDGEALSEVAGGGAVFNGLKSVIETVEGDFVGNDITVSATGYAASAMLSGGTIYNYKAEIGSITGNFVGNSSTITAEGEIYASAVHCGGSAIYNNQFVADDYSDLDDSVIGDITGDFISNSTVVSTKTTQETYSPSISSYSGGAAIFNNDATIGNVTGDFIGNTAKITSESKYYDSYSMYSGGGAIYNSSYGNIGNITGDFINNSVSIKVSTDGDEDIAGAYAYYIGGGAIHNSANIQNITGDFIGNKLEYDRDSATGGTRNSGGGAIYNASGASIGYKDGSTVTGGIINSNFYNNCAISNNAEDKLNGGAIWTAVNLSIIADNDTSTFKNNYTQNSGTKDYQAIWIQGTRTLTLNAKNGGSINMYDNINGSGSYTLALTGDGTGTINFISSGAETDGTTTVEHIANFNKAKVSVNNVNVNLNYSDDSISNYTPTSITIDDETAKVNLGIDVDLTNAKADCITTSSASSGILTVNKINFIDDITDVNATVQVLKTQNDNLYLELSDELKDGSFDVIISQTADSISADTNYKDIYNITTEKAEYSGTIETTTTKTANDSIKFENIVKTNVVDVTSEGDTLKLWANSETTEDRSFNFTGATAEDNTYTAVDDIGEVSAGTLSINGEKITIVDPETGEETISHSTVDLAGHSGFELSNDSTLNLNDVTLTGGKDNTVATVENENAVINLKDTTLDGDIASTTAYNMEIGGETTLTGSVGQANAVMNDGVLTLTADKHFEQADVTINGGTLNLVNDTAQQQAAKSFTVSGNMNVNVDADLANANMDRLPENTVVNNGAVINVNKINLTSDSKKQKTTIYFAPESYRNSVSYTAAELSKSTQVTTKYAPIYKYRASYNPEDGFFTFARGSGSSAGDFNPTVLTSPVATQAGAYSNQLQTFNYAFNHSDTFMNMPELTRNVMKNGNKYAMLGDAGIFSPLVTASENAGYWVKPYATFENIPLNHGPKVQNITYGTLIGYDSPMVPIKHGWDRVLSYYIGYNGSTQHYTGVDSYQNGGLAGVTMTLYKGKFFNATTVSAGASVGEASGMYGSETFTSILAGIGNKTGYNFEFKDGRFIIQPNILLSYTFVNTFDYTNAAGVRINSDPFHAIQIAPGVKFIGNTKNGWQPYLAVNMVWNITCDSTVYANNVQLPEMSIDPYVQYGLGLQKIFQDRFIAFLQAMVQNGGRNGVALTGGFRWTIGK